MSATAMPALAQPVTVLAGVGAERAALLARLEIETVHDLLLHRPRRYEDRRDCRPIRSLRPGEAVLTGGTVVAAGVKRWKQGSRCLYEAILEDGTGRLHCRWWNLPFMDGRFATGEELVVFGKVRSLKPTTMDHPETETVDAGAERSIHVGRIVPVYPLTEGLSQRWLRGLLWRTLDAVVGYVEEPWPALAPELPMPRAKAVRLLHFPGELAEAEAARQRLALDEFIALQIPLQRRRRRLETQVAALPCAGDNRLMRPFLAQLDFQLTPSQTEVLRQIRADLGGAHPMRRLLQGDVGSGKTVVAACAALMALESGFEVAFMAPTEVLAGQQFDRLRAWFEPLGVRCELRTGSRKPDGADELPTGSRSQQPTLSVGTHALLEPAFAPARLGLVIIDEQHRFGVAQREQLVRKGRHPHLLVLTATPIPRTLGLTLYGDLDVAVIAEPPPGRGRLRTFVRTPDALPKVWAFVRGELSRGRQAFIVYPRVEEADPVAGLKAVLSEHQRLETALAPHRLGLLHGRLAPDEKDRIMAAFRAREFQVLVATSLIEVGVDVPNASVMVVESAESFGLAQLHQLRGRIARSPHPAYCILVATAKTPEARQRLEVLETTQDGFAIAEADLRLRGPGELLGQSQSGLPPFRFGDLAQDLELIRRARTLAGQWLDLASPEAASGRARLLPSRSPLEHDPARQEARPTGFVVPAVRQEPRPPESFPAPLGDAPEA